MLFSVELLTILLDLLPNQTVPPVRGEHDDGGDGALERSMEVCEAFDVQHVHLVHKQHTRYELSHTLVNVAVYHLVDLSTQLI